MAKTKNPKLEAERKKSIMEAVYRFLSHRPVSELTLEKISVEAKLSKGLLNYYFKSKDRLIKETMKFVMDREKAKFLNLMNKDIPPPQKILEVFNVALPSRKEIENLTMFLMEVWSYNKNNPDNSQNLIDNYAEYGDVCKKFVEKEGASIKLDKEDLEILPMILYCLMDGISLRISLDPKLDVDGIRSQLLGFFFKHFQKYLTA
ncbi:TetR/AcrR family transcriptional regulator [bacterium]|nr:TetR/AcrR family transcriptional regulator [bacterium]